VSLAFDGTPLPLAIGMLVYAACALALMRRLGAREARQPV
jgi:hypothetical protein